QLAETIAGCPSCSRRASTKPRDPIVDTEHSSLYGALRVGGSGTWLPAHRTVHLPPVPENATHPSVLPISGLNYELSWAKSPMAVGRTGSHSDGSPVMPSRLCEILQSQLHAQASQSETASDEIEAILVDLVGSAQRAYPTFSLPPDVFVAYLGEKLP